MDATLLLNAACAKAVAPDDPAPVALRVSSVLAKDISASSALNSAALVATCKFPKGFVI